MNQVAILNEEQTDMEYTMYVYSGYGMQDKYIVQHQRYKEEASTLLNEQRISIRERSRNVKLYRKHSEIYTRSIPLPFKLVKIYRSRWSTETYIGRLYVTRLKEIRVGEIYTHNGRREYIGHIDSNLC